MTQTEILAIKDAVRERDGWKCTQCGMTNDEHLAKYRKKLDVHRTTPGSLYTVEGCVAVCRKCHGKLPHRQPGQPDLAAAPGPIAVRLDLSQAAVKKLERWANHWDVEPSFLIDMLIRKGPDHWYFGHWWKHSRKPATRLRSRRQMVLAALVRPCVINQPAPPPPDPPIPS